MNKNVKVDWDAFNYIHSNNTRDAFQKLTEQLFCFEYNQPYGIFRFFNQPYIETMPISQGSETIGFQSKYYDPATSLSSKKQDLINAITGAHSKYPALSKIVFYINKEPGMGKSEQNEKPKYINDVEEHGEKYGIHVEWKGLNQIETILLQPELETVRNYFFDTDGGIRKTIAQIQSHTTSMFDSIATDIQYQGISIRIQREAIDIDEFLQSEKRILVVYGDGGCGKSALVKQQLGTENHFPVWFFRAIDMDNTTVPEFVRRFGDNTWEEVLSVFDNCSRKICIIDSAEKALEIHNQKTVEIIIRSLQNHGWHIIVTIRTSYLNSFINSLLKSSEVHKYSITNLSLDELTNLDTTYMLQLPSEPKTRELFCNLFNLKLYLSEGKNASINSSSDFHCFLWNRIICDTSKQGDALHVKRGETAKKMATPDSQQIIREKLLEDLSVSDNTERLLISLIQAQDLLRKQLSFWTLWNSLFQIIESFCNDGKERVIYNCEHNTVEYYGDGLDKIITTYLLAMPGWQEDTREWHTLTREEASSFFRNAADYIGYHPYTLYSISRVLNTVGYKFDKDGVGWLATIIRNNPHLRNCQLPMNTDYYLEEYLQRVIHSQQEELKRNRVLRKQVMDILDYMVDRGSTCGYFFRESFAR